MNKFVVASCAAALCGLAGSSYAVIGDSILTNGLGDVTVEVLPSDAGFTSELWLVSPGSPVFIATNRDTGFVANLGTFPAGEMIFELRVRDTGNAFQTGPGSRNGDGLPHADVTPESGLSYLVGFEDIFGGGDMDYNDCVFRFTGVVPAPASAGLFGLAALVATRRRR